jgi:serine/threonine protein kinase
MKSDLTGLTVMDYAPNGDVRSRIDRAKANRKPLPLETVLTWVGQTVQALIYLHRQGKIHR